MVFDILNNGTTNNITTYGAIILPFDRLESKVEANPKDVCKLKGKFISALKNTSDSTIINNIANHTQIFNNLVTYMEDKRNNFNGNSSSILEKGGKLYNVAASKFSGIAVAQAIMDGKVTSKEAIDYLFMGFAPALGVTGSLMGYSGLNQMKDALSNGKINVGSFVGGFAKSLKGATDLKDFLQNKVTSTDGNILEFDLTISHGEHYQSETPDRRVQSGQSLNEYIHNMPETFEIQCALQEGKRYSKAEFRAIIKLIRDRKDVVSLVLGDEIFDDLVLTDFSTNTDCTKSGFDFSLSFKKLVWGEIKTNAEVNIQKLPITSEENSALLNSSEISLPNINSSGGGGAGGVGDYNLSDKEFYDALTSLDVRTRGESMLHALSDSFN